MHKLAISVIALLAASLTSACAQNSAEPPLQGDVAEGRRMAEVYCATCHAIGAEGESRHPSAPPFRQLSRQFPVTHLEEAFAEGILVGHPDMPEFAFTPEQIEDLLSYLQSIQETQGG